MFIKKKNFVLQTPRITTVMGTRWRLPTIIRSIIYRSSKADATMGEPRVARTWQVVRHWRQPGRAAVQAPHPRPEVPAPSRITHRHRRISISLDSRNSTYVKGLNEFRLITRSAGYLEVTMIVCEDP